MFLERDAVIIVSTSFNAGMFANSSRMKFVLYGNFKFGQVCATAINASYACFTNIAANAWYVVFSSCIFKNTAVFSLPTSLISKSLYESISDNASCDEKILVFVLNVDMMPPRVSFGALIQDAAAIYAGLNSPLLLKYSLI